MSALEPSKNSAEFTELLSSLKRKYLEMTPGQASEHQSLISAIQEYSAKSAGNVFISTEITINISISINSQDLVLGPALSLVSKKKNKTISSPYSKSYPLDSFFFIELS